MMRRGLLFPRRLLQRAPALAAPPSTAIRALSNVTRGVKSDGFYVSKKAVKATLVVGAALTGALLYLEREDEDRKEIGLLLERSQSCLEKGDSEQSMREQKEAFDLLKQNFPEDKGVIALAMAIGASHEKMDQFAAAMPFYREALEYLSLESRVVYREDLRVVMLDRLGQCYKQTGDSEAAEKHFKQAIEVYDQLKGRLSLSPESANEPSVLSRLDEDILNVFLHYIVLLSTLQRPDDALRARRRVVTIARGSPQLRGQVEKINRQVDDYIALEKIREERKLAGAKETEGSDVV